MVSKLRLVFFVLLMIPQGVMFWMASNSLLQGNKFFNEIEAVSLASALILVLGMPSLTVEWLVGKHIRDMGNCVVGLNKEIIVSCFLCPMNQRMKKIQ